MQNKVTERLATAAQPGTYPMSHFPRCFFAFVRYPLLFTAVDTTLLRRPSARGSTTRSELVTDEARRVHVCPSGTPSVSEARAARKMRDLMRRNSKVLRFRRHLGDT
jgi:hypothetical protein